MNGHLAGSLRCALLRRCNWTRVLLSVPFQGLGFKQRGRYLRLNRNRTSAYHLAQNHPDGYTNEIHQDVTGSSGLSETAPARAAIRFFIHLAKFGDTATKSSLTTTLPISNCRSVALLSAATGLLPAYAYWLNDCGLTAENGRTANAFYSLADVLGGHSAESATWSNLEGNVAGLCKQ